MLKLKFLGIVSVLVGLAVSEQAQAAELFVWNPISKRMEVFSLHQNENSFSLADGKYLDGVDSECLNEIQISPQTSDEELWALAVGLPEAGATDSNSQVQLPYELLRKVGSYLESDDFSRFRLVNKVLYQQSDWAEIAELLRRNKEERSTLEKEIKELESPLSPPRGWTVHGIAQIADDRLDALQEFHRRHPSARFLYHLGIGGLFLLSWNNIPISSYVIRGYLLAPVMGQTEVGLLFRLPLNFCFGTGRIAAERRRAAEELSQLLSMNQADKLAIQERIAAMTE